MRGRLNCPSRDKNSQTGAGYCLTREKSSQTGVG